MDVHYRIENKNSHENQTNHSPRTFCETDIVSEPWPWKLYASNRSIFRNA